MSLRVDLLLPNALTVGATFTILAILTLLGAALVRQLVRLLLPGGSGAEATSLHDLIEHSVQRWSRRLLWFCVIALVAVGGWATLRGHSLSQLVSTALHGLPQTSWRAVSLTILTPVALLALALVVSHRLRRLLDFVSQQLQQTQSLTRLHERMQTTAAELKSGSTAVAVFGSLLLYVQISSLPDGARQALRVVAYLGGCLPFARCSVSAARLAVEIVFEISSLLGQSATPLRYLAQVRHLLPITQRASDYLLYVGIGSWTVDRLTPGTWAAQAGPVVLRLIAIFYLSRVFVELCLLFLNEFFLQREGQSPAELQQRQTLVPVAASILRYLIYFMAVVMSLREAGLDPTPLLAGAGVAGIAVGLGAQSFVGDIVAGFFILFENLFLVGDLVQIGEVKGKVEEIGVRTTALRDEEGILHILPNSEVRKIASHSRGYKNVIVDVPVPYGEDLHRVFDRIGEKMASLRDAHPAIMSPTELAIEELRDTSIVLRSVTMVRPEAAEDLTNIVRLAIWEALAAARVAAPFTRHMLLPAPAAELATPPSETRSSRIPAVRADIQKLKAYNLYLALDVDNNGWLEQSDVKALAKRLVASPEQASAKASVARLEDSLHTYWLEITKTLDRNEDGRISREEFLAFCGSLSDDLSGPAGDAVRALASAIFAAYDHNQSSTLSEREFLYFTRAHGLADGVASAGFRLIDRDHNGHISQEEWQRFMCDLFVSRKLNDASAVVFGPGCRDGAG